MLKEVFGIGLAEKDRIIIDTYEEMFKSDKNIMELHWKNNPNKIQ